MLVDNRKIIRAANEFLYNNLVELEKLENKNVIVEPAKKEGETMAIILDGKHYYLNSKYNPIAEAQKFNESFEDLAEPEHLLFIGVGMGYHIIELLKLHPDTKYSIYEPNIEVLAAFLEKQNLSKLKAKLITVFTHKEEIKDFTSFVEKYASKGEIVRWVISNKLYEQEIINFEKAIAEKLKESRFAYSVSAAHQQRWQMNGIINFPKILKTPSVFDLNTDILKNKPVVIVAAGPSLSLDLEYIREIKEKKKACLFAVGSAVNALIVENIIPDVFVSFDPKPGNNEIVFKKIKENKLPIPLFFGSSIGYETLNDYPGPMMHFFVERETISQTLLNINQEEILVDKPSVAIQAFEICARLNMGPIIFAGQNCAFLNNKRYTSQIKYTHVTEEITDEEKQSLIEVESVDGDIVYTNTHNHALLKTLELMLQKFGLDNVYNTTKHGAKIEGAPYVDMEFIMKTKLAEDNVVTDEWIDGHNTYNLEEVLNRYKGLEESFDDFYANMQSLLEVIQLVREKHDTKVYSNLDVLYDKFDRYYNLINANKFFLAILAPMVQVQRYNFIAQISEVKNAKNPRIKLDKFMKVHVPYIKAIFTNLIVIQDGFKELNQIKTW